MLHLISIEVNEKEPRIVIFKESIENTQKNEIWKKVTETDKTCTTSILCAHDDDDDGIRRGSLQLTIITTTTSTNKKLQL